MSDSKQFMQEEDDGIDWDAEPKKPVETAIDEPYYEETAFTEFIGVDFKWQESRADPINFRPYNPLLIPGNVNIRIFVPAELVESYDLIEGTNIASECTLSLAGYSYCQKALAKAIQKAFIQ